MSKRAHIRVALALLTGGVAVSVTAAGPTPGTLETYRDWTIGCDNGGRCEAASLLPDDDDRLDSVAGLHVVRDSGPDAQPRLWIRLQSDVKTPVQLLVDGAIIATLTPKDDMATLGGPNAFTAITRLARGSKLELRSGTASVGNASLAGSAAALRYMDAKQGRAGTITALVAKGVLAAKAVPAAPALPVVLRVAVPQVEKGTALWREESARALRLSGCADEQRPEIDTEVHPLGTNIALILIPCGSGAYNYTSVPMIASGPAGRRTFAFARFDLKPGWSEESTTPMLVNASWDTKTATLMNFAKGRGLGDCGNAESFVWDGAMFRLSEASMMGECRGAWDWITTWRSTVKVRK